MSYNDAERRGLNGEYFDYASATPEQYSGYERGRLEREEAQNRHWQEVDRQQRAETDRQIEAGRQRLAEYSKAFATAQSYTPPPVVSYSSRLVSPSPERVSSRFPFDPPTSDGPVSRPGILRRGVPWVCAILAGAILAVAQHSCGDARGASGAANVEILDLRTPGSTVVPAKSVSTATPKAHAAKPVREVLPGQKEELPPLPYRAPTTSTSSVKGMI